jgi:lysophospholipase L1-like esterase
LQQSGIKIFTLVFLLFLTITGRSQEIAIDTLNIADTVNTDEFPFINYEGDTLINGRYLTPFFNKLLNLENCDSIQLSIVHIGDSHIQADFLTREVRKNFQLRFGNAGRGLVFPLRVAGTNEPNDYRSSTNTAWTVAKINSTNRYPDPGISGISMLTDDNGAYFDITTYNHDDLDYAFDQVTLIHTKDSLQFDCRITDSAIKFGYLMSAVALEPGNCNTWVPFTHPTNFVRIQAEQTEAGQNSFTVNGVILQNSFPGVLYHSIGINGAHYSDYNNSSLFFRQLRILKPDLVLVSLGANEGADVKITGDEIIASVIALIRNIRSMNPEACILITTPADDFYRKKYKNPYLKTVQQALVKSAELEKVACWDMYTITGGFGSCTEWRKAAMMQRDGVHFNKQGYALQGTLLYKALIDSYLKYAAD